MPRYRGRRAPLATGRRVLFWVIVILAVLAVVGMLTDAW